MLVTPEVFTQLARAGETEFGGQKGSGLVGRSAKNPSKGIIGVMAIQTYTPTARLAGF